MRRALRFSVLTVCLAFCLTGCSAAIGASASQSGPKRYEATWMDVFDTVTTVVGYADSEEEFEARAQEFHDEMVEYHQLYDIYNDYEGVSNIKTISTGGQLLNSCYALVGEEAYKTIDRFTADFFFFSCRGISAEGNLTDISEAEDYVRNKMMEHSSSSYLLCNSNKIGTTYYHKLCHASQLNGIISDSEPPENLKP